MTLFSSKIMEQAAHLLDLARDKGIRIATAESCTGGLIAGALTAIPGSSDVFERGFVVYSNQAKTELLQVPAAMIVEKGAVSAEVARTMAEGALRNSAAGIAVSCTGIAGPGGGTAAKPVGLVHLAVKILNGEARGVECRFGEASREDIRIGTVAAALQLLSEAIRTSP